MSRGTGSLQRRVMDELERTSANRLPWAELKTIFAAESQHRGLHRAVRSLHDRGLVFDHHVGGRRYVALTAWGDTELTALYEAAHAQLAAVARTRGVPVPPLEEPIPAEHEPRSPETARWALRARAET